MLAVSGVPAIPTTKSKNGLIPTWAAGLSSATRRTWNAILPRMLLSLVVDVSERDSAAPIVLACFDFFFLSRSCVSLSSLFVRSCGVKRESLEIGLIALTSFRYMLNRFAPFHAEGRDTTTMDGNKDEDVDNKASITALTRSPSIQVCSTNDRGRGVFAVHDIPAGTLIEVSPVLIVPSKEYDSHNLQSTIFESYLFTWSRANDGGRGGGGDMALALGLGSLFNHSEQSPNVSFSLNKVNSTIEYTTKRTVCSGEELCIFYGHGVHFGEQGQLLVDRNARALTPETEETLLSNFGALADDVDVANDEHETQQHENSHENHCADLTLPIPLRDLPLRHVTRHVAPEDIPLETCK